MSRKLGPGMRSRLDLDRDVRQLGGESRGRTVADIRRDTLHGGARGGRLNTVPGGTRFDTIYAGKRFDTIYAGKGFDTIYAGKRFDTIYAGKRFYTIYGGMRFNTVYGGGRRDTLFGGLARRHGGAVTATVKDPATNRAMSVVYNPTTRQYLDTTTKRWMAAPGWMRAQIG